MIEYVPAIFLYSMGMFLIGYEFGKAKYKHILEQVEKIVDECFDKEDLKMIRTSVSLANNKMQANTLADNKLQAKEEV